MRLFSSSRLITTIISFVAINQYASGLLSRSSSSNQPPAGKIVGSAPSEVQAAMDGSNGSTKKRRKERVKLHEKVVFFPTAARRSEDGRGWDIPIHGWIYEPETKDLARRAIMTSIRKYIGLSRHEEAAQILKRRVGSFMVDNEKRKEISVQIGCDNANGDHCRIFKLPKSQKNGHFKATLNLDDSELNDIPGAATGPTSDILRYRAVTTEKDDERVFEGYAQLVPETGLSVISDVDDTVKITGVGNKKQLLKNTFMEEFKQVPGMSELYQEWSEVLDARFHFVSSSPWQLWEELAEYLHSVGFPLATYHLKPIRVKDRSLFDLWKSPLETKIAVIESILKAFPDRKFLLVGDTGEKDPEVYGIIARNYPDQIKGIYVRNVTGETGKEERYAEAWCDLNRDMCALFDEPTDIQLPADILMEFGSNEIQI